MTAVETTRLVDVPEDVGEFNEWAVRERWSDGLPLIPPTPERVERMLAAIARPADDVVAMIPPLWAEGSVRAIAVNTVMAGCRPEFLPIVIAAVETAMTPVVNLYGMLATTHPCGLMVMLNGAVGRDAGINGGAGCFGPGFQANATIGRAVRLVMQNIGGSWPGESDRSTHGSPCKFTFCFAENEQDSPWPPFHVGLGFDEKDSTITVVAGEAPQNIDDHISKEPRALLGTFAATIASLGSNNAYNRDSDLFVVVCPEHARTLAAHGWRREDVQEYLFNAARIPVERWRGRGLDGVVPRPRWIDAVDDGVGISMVERPEDFRVVVAGGAGLHSCWIPTFAVGRSATAVIRTADGQPARSLADLVGSAQQ